MKNSEASAGEQMNPVVGDPQTFKFIENLEGRIRNLALTPKKRENTLIPLFETISNSIHSIQERFQDGWVSQGKISVYVHTNTNSVPESFTTEDNGAGLNGDNWLSFLTYDTTHKITKGGKGVGRLTWLKVFTSVNIESTYIENNTSFRRSFDFRMDNENPIQDYKHRAVPSNSLHYTRVFLRNFRDSYGVSCPHKTALICNKIIAHFLPILISEECPSIVVEDADDKFDLREILEQNKHSPQKAEFEIEDIGAFTIQHVLLNKALIEGKAEHKIYYAAHGRIAGGNVINNQTGLNTSLDYEDIKVVYVGVLSGEFFDRNVTQERNNFDIDDETMKKISKRAEESAKEYLSKPIEELIEEKSAQVTKVLHKFPRYQHLVRNTKDFARSLPLNARTEEDIYRELSVHDFRKSRDTEQKLKNVLSNDADPATQQDFENLFTEIVKSVSEQERSSLAEYVVRRKAVIDLLDTRLGFIEDEPGKRYKEDAIHKIICPIKVTSNDVDADSHNLWLIDDRLAYYNFWASDESIKNFVQSSESKGRPDLALFEGCTLFNAGEKSSQPVVIVEFKRPARKDYTEKENPIKQVYKYIRDLRERTVTDSEGKLITSVDKDTPFFCYVVCDITPKMQEFMEYEQITNRIPGGRGYFGYHKDFKAYVEVIQYSEIVKDARIRNEAFFKELGI